MSGKKEVCRQQLRLKFQQKKKSHEKMQNEKNAAKNKK